MSVRSDRLGQHTPGALTPRKDDSLRYLQLCTLPMPSLLVPKVMFV